MFEIVFLGTSASAPSARRGLSSQVIKHNEHRFLVDCGEGTQRQILQSGIGFKRLNQILITHGHLDHILGLAGLLSTYMRWEAIDTLDIYGGRTALDRIHDLLFDIVLRGVKAPIPIELHEVQPGIFYTADDFSITAFPVSHRGTDNFGYLFEEKSRRAFLPAKAESLNIPPGPFRRELVDGNPVTLPDGRTIHPDDVLGPLVAGTRMAHVGDAGETNNLVEFIRGVDALVIEATYLEEEVDMARQFAHLTARQAAELAQTAGVNKLILTHISRRYREKDVLAEAAAIFPNVTVARDLDIFSIKRSDSPGGS
ncbi:MAG: ribonuclease Z [Anaerolineaceae bacterium]